MLNDHGQGIFDMSLISKMAACKSLDEAKTLALAAIKDSSAKLENKLKAEGMVRKSRSIEKLMIAAADFNLSHSGLKSIR